VNSYSLVAGGCNENTIRGNPKDCSSYLVCLHGAEVRIPCPDGLHFNTKTRVCDWPENSPCTGISPPTTQSSNPTGGHEVEVDGSLDTTTTPTTEANLIPLPHGDSPRFAPYVDVTRKETNLTRIMELTGQKDFTLAFALGSSAGCVPKWGAELDLDDPRILNDIRNVQRQGGKMIVALGGAVGPYLEHLCLSVPDLVKAYKLVLDTVKTTHLDLDVEAPIDLDRVNRALAQVQSDRPSTSVSYTLMVQAEEYGLNPDLGLKTIQNAKERGVKVDIVNGMTMEYGASSPDWGDAVIGAAKSILNQMKTVWPEKSDRELKRMLGVTPMLGRNFNGKIFRLEHGRKLVNWANANGIGFLSFWSMGRDNGKCPSGPISPTCSSISQQEFEFTSLFQKFKN